MTGRRLGSERRPVLCAEIDSTYGKLATTLEEQVHLLVDRGFDVGDQAKALKILNQVGFFRLSGYWYTFRIDRKDDLGNVVGKNSEVEKGTALERVYDLYVFDGLLRSALLEGISEVEVALRSQVGNTLGKRSAFAHRVPSALSSSFAGSADGERGGSETPHAAWVEEYSRQEARSREQFSEHFRTKYGPHLPIWAATEVMPFGALEMLFTGMRQDDRQLIASEFDLHLKDGTGDAALLSSMMVHLRLLRNTCAHHGRVWNKTFQNVSSVKQVPDLAHTHGSVPKVYGSVAILIFLIARVDSTSSWRENVRSLIESSARRLGLGLGQLGFPEGWQDETIWQTGYGPDPLSRRRALLAASLDLMSASEARQRVASDKGGNPRGVLRYLVKQCAVSYIQMGEAKLYPAFQFDESNVSVAVADVNATILKLLATRTADDAEASVLAFEWWAALTGPPSESPMTLVRAGAISPEEAVLRFRSHLLVLEVLPRRRRGGSSRSAQRAPLGARSPRKVRR